MRSSFLLITPFTATIVNGLVLVPACDTAETVCCTNGHEDRLALDCEQCTSFLKPSVASRILLGSAVIIRPPHTSDTIRV